MSDKPYMPSAMCNWITDLPEETRMVIKVACNQVSRHSDVATQFEFAIVEMAKLLDDLEERYYDAISGYGT